MENKGLAIVTGASRGIGLTVAKGLAADGYRIVLIARNREQLESVKKTILESVDKALEPLVLAADISDVQIGEKIKSITAEYGPAAVLVNCAGIFIDGTLGPDIEHLRKILEINVIAQFAIIKAVVESMKDNGNGYVFNISSRAGVYGFPGGGLYGVSKFALTGLTESLFREFSPKGIRFTSICPGWVNTEMAKEAGTTLADNEMIQPEDILQTIRYLLGLSGNVCIKEIVLEMKKSFL